jgi:hypothetical protein
MRRRGGTRPVLWLVSASPTPAGPLRFMLDHSAMVMIVHVTWVRSTLHGRYASELAIMQAQHRNRPHGTDSRTRGSRRVSAREWEPCQISAT